MSNKANEEDFACDNFAPQKWRKDVCRNCYQVLRLHKKREEKKTSPQVTRSNPPPSTVPTKVPTATGEEKVVEKPKLNSKDLAIEGHVTVTQLMKEEVRVPDSPPKPAGKLRRASSSDQKLPPRPPPPAIASKSKPKSLSKMASTESIPPSKEKEDEKPLLPPPTPPSLGPSTSTSLEQEPVMEDITNSTKETQQQTNQPSEPEECKPEEPPCVTTSTPIDPSPIVQDKESIDEESKNIAITLPSEDEPNEAQVATMPTPSSDANELTGNNTNEVIVTPPTGDNDQQPAASVSPTEPDEEELHPPPATLSPKVPAPPAPTPTQQTNSLEGGATSGTPPSANINLYKVSQALESTQEQDEVTTTEEITNIGSLDEGPPPIPPPPALSDSPGPSEGTPSPPLDVPKVPSLSPSSAVPPPVPPPPNLPLGPPPPPPPPPVIAPPEIKIPKVKILFSPQTPGAPPKLTPPPPSVREHKPEFLQEIEKGTKLRHVEPPVERTPTEEKITDIQSELKQRVLKIRKKENETLSSVVVEKRGVANSLCQQLSKYQNKRTYLHHLVDILKKLDDFVAECGLPVDVMEKKMNWPLWLIDQLRNVVKLMNILDDQVVAVERLCTDTMKSQQLNVEKVQKCVTNVIFTVRNVKNDLSTETNYTASFNTFPVDEIDIDRLLRRAVEALTPLLDKLYDKALQSHAMISDPSVSKFDLNFRLQNSIRLLRMCCQMSDTLQTHLDVQRHPKYSEAMLKGNELDDDYKRQLAILEKKGEWDSEESITLKPSYTKRSPAIVQEESTVVDEIVQAINREELSEEELLKAADKITEELFSRAEVKLIKMALSSCKIKVINSVILLRNKFLSEDSKKLHQFDWLHECLLKGNQEFLEHLITKCEIPVNCQSTDAGNSALHIAVRRQDWPTMACLIKLGADPLIVNSKSKNPLQMMALKHFKVQHFPEIRLRELPFSLSAYINNPSLSDGKLVSNEGEEFHIHRLVLCGQSPVFRSMFESEHWAGDRTEGNKVTLPNINSKTIKLLLQYLYTGESNFPHDDLNSWIELLTAADEYLLEPLRLQCERVLSEKIDEEVVLPMLFGSHRCSAKKLLVNCCNFLLENYQSIDDPEHKALLYIVNNFSDIVPAK